MDDNKKLELILNFLKEILTSFWFWLGLAVLVILIIIVIRHKSDISHFLRNFRLKGKNFDLYPENHGKQEEELPKKEELAKEEVKEEEQTEAQKVEEPKTLEEWRMEMIFSTFDKNQTRADEAFQKMQELNADPVSRKKDEILYLKFSHTAGKTDAIQRIKAFLTDAEVEYKANIALGFCYANSEDFENSTKFC
ncbi:MAG: hypothetical protein O3C43_10835 [Verrucomicrobia bacterium]|nr:hypothetical protein [Verrucomicrobiota bacterium]